MSMERHACKHEIICVYSIHMKLNGQNFEIMKRKLAYFLKPNSLLIHLWIK